MKNVINLNIGCGPTGQLEGFVNIDNSKAVLLSSWPKLKCFLSKVGLISHQKLLDDWAGVKYMDASKKLSYENDSVSNIYTSHFLEHVPRDRGERVLSESYRVLKAGGVMRVVVPDLVWHAQKYIDNTNKMLADGANSFDRAEHDAFLETVYGAYLDKKRYGLLHSYMYDIPTLFVLLTQVGFRNVEICGYQQGKSDTLYVHDNRPEDSIYIECVK